MPYKLNMKHQKGNKMRTTFLCFIFIIGITNCSCTNNRVENKDIYNIPDSLFQFFPNKDETYKTFNLWALTENAQKTDLPYFTEEFAIQSILKVYSCKSEKIRMHTLDSLIKKSLYIVSTDDSDNYFMIGSERDISNKYDSIMLRDKFYETDKIIPYFHELVKEMTDIYDPNTNSGLPKGYKVGVLKSGNHYVLPDKYKYNWSKLPDEIKHGYISGIAYKEDKPYIIYWVVAW